VQNEDEDAAESVRAPDENFSLIHAEGKPAPANPPATQPAPPAVAKVANPRPDNMLAAAQAQLVKTAINTPSANVPRPQFRPALKEDASEEYLAAVPGRNWTIQIGAYADKALALEQLKTYAGKAQDVLARASQIVAPLQVPNGHTIYRARFGLFAEQEAREVCNRLTQRGQTCFAAVQTR
jgi:D-alanyl-D-alanine carboxypeptidase